MKNGKNTVETNQHTSLKTIN